GRPTAARWPAGLAGLGLAGAQPFARLATGGENTVEALTHALAALAVRIAAQICARASAMWPAFWWATPNSSCASALRAFSGRARTLLKSSTACAELPFLSAARAS